MGENKARLSKLKLPEDISWSELIDVACLIGEEGEEGNRKSGDLVPFRLGGEDEPEEGSTEVDTSGLYTGDIAL